MSSNSTWDIVLPAQLRQEALQHVSRIAASALEQASALGSANYWCEVALLHAYLHLAFPDLGYDVSAVACLNNAGEGLRPSGKHGLHGGLSGIAWTFEHVAPLVTPGHGGLDVTEDPIEDLDRIILEQLNEDITLNQFDLVSGLVGKGVYLTERLPRSSARNGVEKVIEKLRKSVYEDATGAAWYTAPQFLHDTQRQLYPLGYYDLGVAHGVPGVIFFLSQMFNLGVRQDVTGDLLLKARQWLKNREATNSGHYRYGARYIPGMPTSAARLGWCYGDLGVGAVLSFAAQLSGSEDDYHHSISVVDGTLSWTDSLEKIRDAGLCHGAFGAAHIYNRLFQRGKQDRYKQAAIKWYEHGLSLREEGIGDTGFFAWRDDLPPYRHRDISFLSGEIGIALTLLASMTSISPRWDRLLLLSSKPCAN